MTKGAATKNTPMAMISAAEILLSRSRLSWSALPRPVAVRPRMMKMAEKLATKMRLGGSTFRQPACSISLAETPVTAER